jgi:RNA polymerase sigma-70 factor (ECF subfamily)
MSSPAAQQTALVQSLFIQHSAALRGFVLALLPDFGRVDDVIQETFLTVTAKAADFRPNSNFLAWASAIAKFKVFEALRAAGRQPQSLSQEVLETLCAAEPDPQPDASEPVLQHLSHCISQLAPQSRRAIELCYRQAHKPAEVARLMGWTAEAVYVALSRARTALRDCVKRKMGGEQPA